MKKSKLTAIHILVCLFLLHACTQSDLTETIPLDKQHALTIQMHVPGQQAGTRALEADDQSAISQIIAVCFDAATKKYAYHSRVDDGITVNESGELSFTLTIPKGTYNILLLANSQQIFETAYGTNGADLDKDFTRDEVAEALILATTTAWPTTTTGTGWQLPMYGEITSIAVDGPTTPGNAVEMTRMHAAIDVKVAGDCSLELTDIYVYRYSTQGTLIPADPADMSAPTEPQSTKGYDREHTDALHYEVPAEADPTEYKNSIFLLEAPAGSDDALDKNICLIIGAKYDGADETTYYRVDIAKATDNDPEDPDALIDYEYLPLLRNYRYLVAIQKVLRAGYADKETALANRPFTVTTVHQQDPGDELADMVYDNQHYLGITRKNINLEYGGYPFAFEATRSVTGEAVTYQEKLRVVTDDEWGWTSDADWLSIADDTETTDFNTLENAPTTGNPTGDYQIVAQPNTTDEERTGTLTLKVKDNLTTKITVTQGYDTRWLSSIVIKEGTTPIANSTEFLFVAPYGTELTARTLDVTWPASYGALATTNTKYEHNNDVKTTFANGAGDLPTTIDNTVHGGWGEVRLKLQPSAATASSSPWSSSPNQFAQRSSTIIIKRSSTTTGQRSIYARQVVPHATSSTDHVVPALREDLIGYDSDAFKDEITTNCNVSFGDITFSPISGRSYPGVREIGWLTRIDANITWTEDYIRRTIDVKYVTFQPFFEEAILYTGHTANFPIICEDDIASGKTLFIKTITPAEVACGNSNYVQYSCLGSEGNPYPTHQLPDGKCIMLEHSRESSAQLITEYGPMFLVGVDEEDTKPCPSGWKLPTNEELLSANDIPLVKKAFTERSIYAKHSHAEWGAGNAGICLVCGYVLLRQQGIEDLYLTKDAKSKKSAIYATAGGVNATSELHPVAKGYGTSESASVDKGLKNSSKALGWATSWGAEVHASEWQYLNYITHTMVGYAPFRDYIDYVRPFETPIDLTITPYISTGDSWQYTKGKSSHTCCTNGAWETKFGLSYYWGWIFDVKNRCCTPRGRHATDSSRRGNTWCRGTLRGGTPLLPC